MATATAYLAEMAGMTPSEYILRKERPQYVRGWDLDCKRQWPTLTRASPDEAWGFSLTAGAAGDMGQQAAHWRGIVAHRGDVGTWLKVTVCARPLLVTAGWRC